jgi:hypothetical protein
MIVSDSAYVTTGQTQQGGGAGSASPSDNQLAVTTGSAFGVGEVLLLDAEWMKVLAVTGNTLLVKRGWSGSVLSSHAGATILSARLLTVVRAALGTSGATHTNGTVVSLLTIPGLVKELAVAEALVGITQEPAAYSGASDVSTTRGGGQVVEPSAGAGLPDLRGRCERQFGRVARTRVV